jgi:hypothetical protein
VAGLVGSSLFATSALAQSGSPAREPDEGTEHTLVLGVGGAVEAELGDRTVRAGPNVMVEWDAVEDWLELEAEASLLPGDQGVAVPLALTFKKPFRLSRWAEVMVGAGPQLVYVSTPATRGAFFDAEGVIDFMFWPTRRLGLWIEPSYDVVARGGPSQGIGGTGGLLVGW